MEWLLKLLLLLHGSSEGMAFMAAAGLVAVAVVVKLVASRRRRTTAGRVLPAVPGLPLIGNLHQLKEKKPHLTFAGWARVHGPIYSIRTGASSMVVLNSTELAKEAMVTKFSCISTRKLSNALTVLTSNKAMVATSDYGEFHKRVKRHIVTSVLGTNAMKKSRINRDAMIDNVLSSLRARIDDDPRGAVSLREPFRNELFRLSLIQALGSDVDSVRVEEFGSTFSKPEMFDTLVVDPMMGAIEVDWRDFFPYLKWVPNKSHESKIQSMATRKKALMKALIGEQRKRIALGEKRNSYLDFLLSEDKSLTEDQLISLVWEAIIETSDTTLVTTEWAMYELAKNNKCQERLYEEIREVCGSEELAEEHLAKLPYLNAVFHETLRRHSPVPIVPIRFVHRDTTLGGYHIPAGTEIAINLYACNMDKEAWIEPDVFDPERFVGTAGHDATDMHKTMAFGAGKRACSGSMQAMLISCVAIGRFIQGFRWELKEGEEEDVDTVQLTTHKLRPMLAYVTPRDRF